MKRIVLMVTVALVMALMMALSGPAFAAIHPLAQRLRIGRDQDPRPARLGFGKPSTEYCAADLFGGEE
jgi:hypothetical protein